MSDPGMSEWAIDDDFEFERKFFVGELPAVAASDPSPNLIIQAYLFAADGYSVRIRVQQPAPAEISGGVNAILAQPQDESIGTVTIKGPAVGGTRYEAERQLDPLVAAEIVRRADHVVTKIRYSVWLGEDGWVLDQFLDDNAPLILAEVERRGPVVDLAIPAFCVSEVSEDDRFRNENLAYRSFSGWAEAYLQGLDQSGPVFVGTLGENRFED